MTRRDSPLMGDFAMADDPISKYLLAVYPKKLKLPGVI
jgi:hypothetical protein